MKHTKKLRLRKEIKQASLYIGLVVGISTIFVWWLSLPTDYETCIHNGTDAKICAELVRHQ